MNKVFLIGNLTRDPETNTTPSGVSCARFSIAVNRPFKQDGETVTDFFNITAWRDLGDRVVQYCKKGNKVAVEGSIQIRNYEDNNGNKRTAVDIIASQVEFLTPKSGAETADGYGGNNNASANGSRKKPQLQAFDDDSDCPF